MTAEKTGACRRCRAACYEWQLFCGAACSAKYEAGDRQLAVESPVLDLIVEKASATHRRSSPVFCEHANECPRQCPCDELCYCKDHSCKVPR